jgi:hypothetical protein
VIGTDYMGSFKYNYHTITSTTNPTDRRTDRRKPLLYLGAD